MVTAPPSPNGFSAVCAIVVGNDAAVALVDPADFDRLAPHRWFLSAGYARRVERLDDRHWRLVSMHRDVMQPAPGVLIDHRNRDRLDNRRCNLREASPRLNVLNSAVSWRNTSGVIGVDWRATRQRWRARLRYGRNDEKLLGYFEHREDAVAARLIALDELLSSLT